MNNALCYNHLRETLKVKMRISCVIGTEWRDIDVNGGKVTRFINNKTIYVGSNDWTVTSVVLTNNFGRITKSLTLLEFYNT